MTFSIIKAPSSNSVARATFNNLSIVVKSFAMYKQEARATLNNLCEGALPITYPLSFNCLLFASNGFSIFLYRRKIKNLPDRSVQGCT